MFACFAPAARSIAPLAEICFVVGSRVPPWMCPCWIMRVAAWLRRLCIPASLAVLKIVDKFLHFLWVREHEKSFLE